MTLDENKKPKFIDDHFIEFTKENISLKSKAKQFLLGSEYSLA